MLKRFLKKQTGDLFITDRLFDIIRLQALRSSASCIPTPPGHPCDFEVKSVDEYRIGYSSNLLNNHYLFCKIARRMGTAATLHLDTWFQDNMATSQPAWEDMDFHEASVPDCEIVRSNMSLPDFVHEPHWNPEFHNIRFKDFDNTLIDKAFKGVISCGDDYNYLQAISYIPHRELIQSYKDVDVLQVSGSHIGVAAATQKPYVTFPYGADLYGMPFEDTEIGWMQARGFKRATRHIASGEVMLDYLTSLGISRASIDMLPFMIDTDTYAPLAENPIADELKAKYPGKRIFLIGARQNWAWKGSEKLLRAIAALGPRREEAVFLTVWYGQDTDRSDALIKELGISDSIVKLGILSKPMLRKYIDAADVCIDQFTLGAMGTFSLESLAIGKPLLTCVKIEKHLHYAEQPPILNACEVAEISEQLRYSIDNNHELEKIGTESRRWIIAHHGYETLWPQYDAVYRKAIIQHHART